MSKIIYVPEFSRYGEPSLTRVTVAKETPKQYRAESIERVLGYSSIGRTVNKAGACFDTELDALLWLAARAREYVRKCQTATAKARSRQAWLEQMIEEQDDE